ncbi:hypothetical protein N8I77_009597 [Diaporthe amygdali]|uniref:Heterokaryon incompatibility domain-containing protein n=1 Tax=Phomopsis amygdali TaxID=1214568 RepID=A0AAD9SBH5_PHOAM|nr:hypothetical protein N8I77_009597 [Diaporthe amygdali]
MAPYQYEPLSSPTTQIRLLELLPGRGIIQCRLKITELKEATDTYEPISYCWKSYSRIPWFGITYKEKNQKSFRVRVDGGDYRISENLHGALRQVRLKSEKVRVLWADAICINQADNEEKSAQVALMAQIYESGFRTLVWLGEADHRTRKAFEVLRDCAHRDSEYSTELEQSDPEPGSSGNQSSIRSAHSNFSVPSGIEQTADSEPASSFTRSHGIHWKWWKSLRFRFNDERLIISVQSIIDRPYFRRAWVVQEIAKSRRVVVMCGKYETAWFDLFDEFDDGNLGIRVQASGSDCYTAMVELWYSKLKYDLLEVASMVSPTQASDPRDKLYGVLGLVPNDLMTVKIDIDYTKCFEEVFYDFSKRLLLANERLAVLSMSYGVSQDKPRNVPSWAQMLLEYSRFDSEIMKRLGEHLPEAPRRITMWTRFKLIAAIEALSARRLLGSAAMTDIFELFPPVSNLINRRLARTDAGQLALCPKETAVNDKLVLLQGSDVPFMLRPIGNHWQIVGECYVHEVMDGSAWDESRCEMLWIE